MRIATHSNGTPIIQKALIIVARTKTLAFNRIIHVIDPITQPPVE